MLGKFGKIVSKLQPIFSVSIFGVNVVYGLCFALNFIDFFLKHLFQLCLGQ